MFRETLIFAAGVYLGACLMHFDAMCDLNPTAPRWQCALASALWPVVAVVAHAQRKREGE